MAGVADSPGGGSNFRRSILDVRAAFHDWFTGLVLEGRVTDKARLEQDKLKITARLVNLVVAGGMLLFRDEDSVHGDSPPADPDAVDEATFFRLLRGTIVTMLNELNAPDVNILKVSLSERFRQRLLEVFSAGREREGRFPVKIVQDNHPGQGVYVGINLRDTRSLGQDISRIERDPDLCAEIASRARPVRHTDHDLHRMFSLTEKA
ncbi:hypothetical protein LLH00_07680 [bacterium]|nr:hypothetical protein [bacterium]